MVFSIKKEHLTRELINRFYDILSSRTGNTSLEIRIISEDDGDTEKSYRIPNYFKVKADDELFERLEKDLTGKVTWESTI